jgi:hypothetical protein
MEPGLLVNLLAGAIFLAVLGGCVFLLLPVASIAGTEKGKGWSWAFLGLLAFMAIWVLDGFSFTQAVLTGAAFHAEYWTSPPAAESSGGGVLHLVGVVVSWTVYLVVMALLAFVTFLALSEVGRASSGGVKVLPLGVFAVLAFLAYLWAQGGKAWLMSFFP